MNAASPRAIPSVDKLLSALDVTAIPRSVVTRSVREHLDELRRTTPLEIPPFDVLVAQLRTKLTALQRSRLQPVINATGILAHTNLGRSPLNPSAATAVYDAARGYSNLEFDLESGERGRRGAYVESALALLCESEDATLVNNGAAALALILRNLVRPARNEVVISRGELVQIGGGFRIPDILETSGARLREIGTTNRTTLDDYRGAIGERTALLLKVHRSNFFMEGFVESPAHAGLAALAREHSLPFVEDLGSGALVDIATLAPVNHEPQPQESIRAGADVVCFSADKLLGGPQAGVIIGRTSLIQGFRRDPLFRALRCDKLIIAALQATVEAYLHSLASRDSKPPGDIPVLAMMQIPVSELEQRADRMLTALASLPSKCEIGTGRSQVGGGVCPRSFIPSVTVRIRPNSISLDDFAARLRRGAPPVIGFISEDSFQLDLRSVPPSQDAELISAIHATLMKEPPEGRDP